MCTESLFYVHTSSLYLPVLVLSCALDLGFDPMPELLRVWITLYLIKITALGFFSTSCVCFVTPSALNYVDVSPDSLYAFYGILSRE